METVKCHPVLRYSADIIEFSDTLERLISNIKLETKILPRLLGDRGCSFFHYFPLTDSIKPSLLFGGFWFVLQFQRIPLRNSFDGEAETVPKRLNTGQTSNVNVTISNIFKY